MGNAFVAGLKNEAPRGRDITKEDRNSEVSHRGTQRDDEGSEFSYSTTNDKTKYVSKSEKCSLCKVSSTVLQCQEIGYTSVHSIHWVQCRM